MTCDECNRQGKSCSNRTEVLGVRDNGQRGTAWTGPNQSRYAAQRSTPGAVTGDIQMGDETAGAAKTSAENQVSKKRQLADKEPTDKTKKRRKTIKTAPTVESDDTSGEETPAVGAGTANPVTRVLPKPVGKAPKSAQAKSVPQSSRSESANSGPRDSAPTTTKPTANPKEASNDRPIKKKPVAKAKDTASRAQPTPTPAASTPRSNGSDRPDSANSGAASPPANAPPPTAARPAAPRARQPGAVTMEAVVIPAVQTVVRQPKPKKNKEGSESKSGKESQAKKAPSEKRKGKKKAPLQDAEAIVPPPTDLGGGMEADTEPTTREDSQALDELSRQTAIRLAAQEAANILPSTVRSDFLSFSQLLTVFKGNTAKCGCQFKPCDFGSNAGGTAGLGGDHPPSEPPAGPAERTDPSGHQRPAQFLQVQCRCIPAPVGKRSSGASAYSDRLTYRSWAVSVRQDIGGACSSSHLACC